MTGFVDQETADLTGVPLADLVPVKVPFTVHNLTFDRPVRVAMEKRLATTYELGSGNDTLSVTLADDQWVSWKTTTTPRTRSLRPWQRFPR